MDIDSLHPQLDELALSSKRMLPDGGGAEATRSSTSSDKRLRQHDGPPSQAAAAAGADADVCSSLLPLPGQQWQQSGDAVEQLEEADQLVLMLAGQQPAAGACQTEGEPLAADDGSGFVAAAAGAAAEDDAAMDEDGAYEAAEAGPGSKEAVAAAADEGRLSPPLPRSPLAAAAAAGQQQQQLRGEELERQQWLRQRVDPVIAHLAVVDAGAGQQGGGASPAADTPQLHMVPLDDLSRNPLLQQFQLRRAAAARAEQTARAVAAGVALARLAASSGGGGGEEGGEVDGMLITDCQ